MRRILLVDDDASVRAVLALALTDEGYGVDTAADGFEALRKMLADPPDAVVLDAQLPIMNGPTFLEAARRYAQTATTPVIAISGARAGLDQCQRFGVTACLAKPFDIEVLATTLDRATTEL